MGLLAAAAVAVPLLCSGRPVVDHGARGAYFRKIASVPSASVLGIRGRGVLPAVEIRRWSAEKIPLDRPAVFLGGRGAGGLELDAGLSWERVHDAGGQALLTNSDDGCDGGDPRRRFAFSGRGDSARLTDGTGAVVARGAPAVMAALSGLRPDFAFRPFWRPTKKGRHDLNWHNPPLGPDDAYFYPGEAFTMEVRSSGDGRMSLLVQGEDGPPFAATFEQAGFDGGAPVSFKRNNELDQFKLVDGELQGREGRSVIATATRLLDARWEEVVLLERSGSEVPLSGRHCVEVRGVETASTYARVYHVWGLSSQGGESLDITP
ncbi:MAG: hypothetical protein KGO96_01785 [Elusimicrobia bacterium]|nr:hypothetical protein [Elusimicrobiota bacterium]MDE2236838.1 hypothetical protein [Elusimicrobiota bacterium]MDE2424626.1 hypothetical protein [Elusimicrobiota bacterium]